ncbi:MAG TPA: hypothetical protein VL588_10435, partial [Bdellovibrionota bacterium]|nr:hypothetical protein [Bdellovibrionota bacterium]
PLSSAEDCSPAASGDASDAGAIQAIKDCLAAAQVDSHNAYVWTTETGVEGGQAYNLSFYDFSLLELTWVETPDKTRAVQVGKCLLDMSGGTVDNPTSTSAYDAPCETESFQTTTCD